MSAGPPEKSDKKRKRISISNEKEEPKRGRKFPKQRKENKSPAKIQVSKSEKEVENDKPYITSRPFKAKSEKFKNKKPPHGKGAKIRSDKSTTESDAKDGSKVDRKKLKEITENRKRKRKPYYDLQKELVALWEKMRQRNIKIEERSKLITETLSKMKGKIPDIAGSHVTSRVLQTCVKYCQPAERDCVYEELRPHFLKLACNTYAVHLVTKMLDHANKEQLKGMISSLHGHVAPFLRHPVGSAVVEHAYKLGHANQKQDLLSEIYSAEFRLFKGIIPKGKGRVLDLLSGELPSKRSSILEHMTLALQPIIEKGIVDHSIVHRALGEYLSIADKSSVADVIQQLSGPLLVRIIHTRDGSKVGALCIIHGNAKERKKIIKGMKGNVGKIAHDEYGSVVLLCILSCVDDTNIVSKIIVRELEKSLKELSLDKYGRRPLLHLLCPNAPRYFSPDVLATLRSTVASLSTSTKEELPKSMDNESSGCLKGPSEILNLDHVDGENDQNQRMDDKHEEDLQASDSLEKISKKEPYTRRVELLIKSGLAQKLTEMCIENVGELLKSQYGKDIIFEIASGGAEGILWKEAAGTVTSLHRAIADLGALPQTNEGMQTDEHLFIQYHSSRTIRKLILESHVPEGVDASSFASILWDVALKGRCKLWAQGHSEKVVSAFMNTADIEVKKKAKSELQPLIDAGKLKISNDRHV
uniref:TSA: Wollemia nobilis Ref_Wollemi_Transcript_18990_2729 transcribed RNA sequence n=1 Tax=Wollemia nobilis TaxID=56998 RepID=A0A0C9S2K7_9CONI